MHIPSLFAEDSDFVYFTVFDREQCDYIGLMEYALHYCKIHSYLTFYEEPAKNIARDLKQYGLKILGARPDISAYIIYPNLESCKYYRSKLFRMHGRKTFTIT